jgi:hypothetical protein
MESETSLIGSIKKWWREAPGWKKPVIVVVCLIVGVPLLLMLLAELFTKRTVVVDPTAAVDKRHDEETKRVTVASKALEDAHRKDMDKLRAQIEEDSVKTEDDLERITIPELKRPGALLEAMKKVDRGEKL